MSTLDLLLSRYGVFLTLADLADLLRRSPAAIRQALARGDGIGIELAPAAVKKGRRLYFRAAEIAKIFEGEPTNGQR